MVGGRSEDQNNNLGWAELGGQIFAKSRCINKIGQHLLCIVFNCILTKVVINSVHVVRIKKSLIGENYVLKKHLTLHIVSKSGRLYVLDSTVCDIEH